MQAVPLGDENDTMALDDEETQRRIFANFAKLKETSNDNENTDREQLAQETALLVQQEVQRWKASVAELEAVLDNNQQQPRPPANVVFPTMPAIVDVDAGNGGGGGGGSCPAVPPTTAVASSGTGARPTELNDTEEDTEEEDSTM